MMGNNHWRNSQGYRGSERLWHPTKTIWLPASRLCAPEKTHPASQANDTAASCRHSPATESRHRAGNHNGNRTSLLPKLVAGRIADNTWESFLVTGLLRRLD